MPLEPVKVGGSLPVPPPTTTDTQPTTRAQGGRPVDGAAVTFFKGVGKKMGDAFKAMGEGIANLAPKHKPTRDQLSPGSKAAFANYLELSKKVDKLERQGNLTPAQQAKLQQAKADLKEAQKEAVRHLRTQFRNGELFAAAQAETNASILDDPPHYVTGGAAQGVADAMNFILLSPKRVDHILKHNMKIDEAVAIYTYTQGAYAGINRELRSGAPGDFIQQLADKVTTGLGRLPPHEGPVYRIVSLPPSVDKQYQEGATVSDRGILSTTFNVDFDLFGGGTSHVLSIVGSGASAGRDVSWLSESPHEKEVIFPPGAEFVVAQRDQATMPQVIGTMPDGRPQYDSQVGLLLRQKTT